MKKVQKSRQIWTLHIVCSKVWIKTLLLRTWTTILNQSLTSYPIFLIRYTEYNQWIHFDRCPTASYARLALSRGNIKFRRWTIFCRNDSGLQIRNQESELSSILCSGNTDECLFSPAKMMWNNHQKNIASDGTRKSDVLVI